MYERKIPKSKQRQRKMITTHRITFLHPPDRTCSSLSGSVPLLLRVHLIFMPAFVAPNRKMMLYRIRTNKLCDVMFCTSEDANVFINGISSMLTMCKTR
jgi:hypothetical protein